MTTSKETVAYILDQLAPLTVRTRAMSGEYCLYCDEKVVALICDDTLYLKPTRIASEAMPDAELAPPYPGAKDHYIVSGDRLEEREWLQELVMRMADDLPLPRKRSRKRSE